MNAVSLRFFATRMDIRFTLYDIFPLTKPPGLHITLQIAAMSSLDVQARVYRKSIPWSFTNFIVTVWLKPSLRNISSISLMMVGGGLSVAGARCWWHSIILILLCLLAPLGDSSSSSASWLSPSQSSGTSFLSLLPSPPCDKLTRFTLLVGLDLILSTIYVIGAQVVVSLATQASLVECYGWWSFFCHFQQLGNILHRQHDSPCCLLLMKMQLLVKSPPSLLLVIARVCGSDKLKNSNQIYRMKLIMTMALWLTLLKCPHLQLNY